MEMENQFSLLRLSVAIVMALTDEVAELDAMKNRIKKELEELEELNKAGEERIKRLNS